MGGQPSRERLLLWALAVVTALGALHLAGRGPLAPPPLTAPSGWSAWLEGQDPVVAAFAVVRLAALGVGWYVVAVGVAGALARLASRRRLVAALDHLTVPPLRRLLAATVTVSLGAGLANPAVAAAHRHDAPAVADSATSSTTAPTITAPTITMRQLPSSTEAEPGATPAPVPAADDRTWTVQPGQCFWSIAEAVLGESLGREATPSEVVPYWNRLIEANRGALADRDNPDLIFPGQVFTVPPP